MKKNRAAFTLIEMMISIVILSIIMTFLYQSYSAINLSNSIYAKKANNIKSDQIKQNILYMDLLLAIHGTINIIKQEKTEDVVLMQSANSIHRLHNPFITYMLKGEKLYRLESFKEIKYPLGIDDKYTVDYFGKVNSFRVYKSTSKVDANASSNYLISVDFKKQDDILLKIKPLNDY